MPITSNLYALLKICTQIIIHFIGQNKLSFLFWSPHRAKKQIYFQLNKNYFTMVSKG